MAIVRPVNKGDMAMINLIEAYAHDFEGLTREECLELGLGSGQADLLVQALQKGGGGMIDPEEQKKMSDAGMDPRVVYQLSGRDGANALRERVKWLEDWSDSHWWRWDYSDAQRDAMKAELAEISSNPRSRICLLGDRLLQSNDAAAIDELVKIAQDGAMDVDVRLLALGELRPQNLLGGTNYPTKTATTIAEKLLPLLEKGEGMPTEVLGEIKFVLRSIHEHHYLPEALASKVEGCCDSRFGVWPSGFSGRPGVYMMAMRCDPVLVDKHSPYEKASTCGAVWLRGELAGFDQRQQDRFLEDFKQFMRADAWPRHRCRLDDMLYSVELLGMMGEKGVAVLEDPSVAATLREIVRFDHLESVRFVLADKPVAQAEAYKIIDAYERVTGRTLLTVSEMTYLNIVGRPSEGSTLSSCAGEYECD